MKSKEALVCPIIAVGASAGGLSAFKSFFDGMKNYDSINMAFVLIQHLAPDYKSMLSDIIDTYTSLEVLEVSSKMKVYPNRVYIIPPNKKMTIRDGVFHLSSPTAERGHTLAINDFMSSLAKDCGPFAAGIILSGTGSDGSWGLSCIKDSGGFTMIQDIKEAEFDGMPISAKKTGKVDYELPAVNMVDTLIEYFVNKDLIQPQKTFNKETLVDEVGEPLYEILDFLNHYKGHDFAEYKSNTILRRLDRRLLENNIPSLKEYLSFLKESPEEVEELFSDLLIGVTSFFRDSEVFQYLEEVIIPKIMETKVEDSILRLWCAGCSTGEEAYSLAILLQEYKEANNPSMEVQIFATDIDPQAIDAARRGEYALTKKTQLSEERLKKHFKVDELAGTMTIISTIREMLIFSEQSIIKDPPFSKIDLLTCRNLLIYFNKNIQEKLMPIFHYSLNTQGYLLLGSAETIGNHEQLFEIVDRKMKIYKRLETHLISNPMILKRMLPQIKIKESTLMTPIIGKNSFTKEPLHEIVEKAILRESNLSGALVNEQGDIFYLHGSTGNYLELTPGELSRNNILKMARAGLKKALTDGLNEAVAKKETIRLSDIKVKNSWSIINLNITIKKVLSSQMKKSEGDFHTIVIEEALDLNLNHIGEGELETRLPEDYLQELEVLKMELKIKEDYLQTSNEELEITNEELKSSNEEMQSINEELQSTNEELETSKEEMQSINEELSTVNSELLIKVQDLSQANNDINNLLSGTNIATLFLDIDHKIMRFTPTAKELIHMIPTDVGRLVSQIATNFVEYEGFMMDINKVMDTLIPIKKQISTIDHQWFDMIIQPYRTTMNVIDGTVITFVDITRVKEMEDLRIISEEKFRTLFETSNEGVLLLDGETGEVIDVNPSFIKLCGFHKEALLKKKIWELGIFKKIDENKQIFSEMVQNKNNRFENMPIVNAKGDIIEVEFISNAFSIKEVKLLQCNIRLTI